MGASTYTYAEAVASEGLEHWFLAQVRMFGFPGGMPKAVVPDNLKSAVIKFDRFDPVLNRTYAENAAHYGTVVLPARLRKPHDTATVEVAGCVCGLNLCRGKCIEQGLLGWALGVFGGLVGLVGRNHACNETGNNGHEFPAVQARLTGMAWRTKRLCNLCEREQGGRKSAVLHMAQV